MNKQEILELWEQAEKKKEDFANNHPLKPYHLIKEDCFLEHADTVPLIRFKALEKTGFVNAAFSTRLGGISQGYFAELNLGFDRGEERNLVAGNYRLFCESMGVNPKTLVLSDQIHDTKLYVVGKEDICGEEIRKKLTGIDGILTNEPEVCLATSYADCVPLFFADKEKKVIASSHSGWRGTVEKMGEKTVIAMMEKFGCRKENMVAVIGPSICQDCYEVSHDVYEAFCKQYEKEQMLSIAYCSDTVRGKYQLDLWAANYLQLEKAGLKKENIHVSGICTCCNSRLLFSHRASKGKRGNLNGFLSIKGNKN